ncbi:MAG: UvrD-helicase domain-containing protein [Halioglobus sp.]
MTIADSGQRERALDWAHSFCVTAPAGSGKTELLIQRFLGLLSRVDRPEQVLAITFTRKAAAEMRDRVLQALHNALADMPIDGEHERTTRALAKATLAHAQGKGWQLVRDVSSLNIRTIDGFCAGLTRQMPVLSGFGGSVHTVDDASELYGKAVDELFSLVGTAHPVAEDLAELLLRFDNNWDRLRALLASMLARRDQWRDYIGVHHTPEESESRLLANVTGVIEEQLESLHAILRPYASELGASLRYSQKNLHDIDAIELPAPKAQALAQWRDLINLLITGTNRWRKQVTVKVGFPAGKGQKQDAKDRHMDLITAMSGTDVSMLEQLIAVRQLPDIDDSTASWQLVLKLSHVLPTLAACLILVFKEEGSVDHAQVAMSALDALGDEDMPTDLALRLDYRYEHILVDEFQDTAINQYSLIDKLTRGWGEHNALNPQFPRTLFIVGDGMQSIYGFRDANVGLFLEAREHGFNGVVPQTLELQCNFRSDHGVVNWVNETFTRAFPATSDASKGQVSYSPAVAVRDAKLDPAVECHGFYGHAAREDEAECLLRQIRQGLDNPAVKSIAVLGRSRSHLAPLINLLQAQRVTFATQDMTPLAGSAAIVDLMSLCCVLANPADRVAMFGVLRAPWCGMTLADLDALGQIGDDPRYVGINDLLSAAWQPETEELLSVDGLCRLRHLATALSGAQRYQDRLALRVWIEQCWVQLGGPGTLEDARQFEDAERFFELLEEADREGLGLDQQWLSKRLEKLYAAGGSPDEKLQIMTLHRAKGLEFDWVLIPGLGRMTRSQDRDVLLWDDYTDREGHRSFLLAADDGSDAKLPTLYNFLARQRKRKSQLEGTRLLYVGATRAVSRLMLTSELKSDEVDGEVTPSMDPPPDTSLLASIWPSFSSQIQLHEPSDGTPSDADRVQAKMRRLVGVADAPSSDVALPESQAGGNVPQRASNRLERHVGTVVHLALEQLAQLPRQLDDDPASVQDASSLEVGAWWPVWRAQLLELGLAGSLLEQACERVEMSLTAVLNDATGRWILDSQHSEAACELALTTRSEEGKGIDLIVDRTFVDQASNTRWVVDYKTSQPAQGESMEDFLAREGALYAPQIERYALALHESEGPSLRCALYFTAIPYLHELTIDVETT